jgi:MFS family permease
MSVDARVVPGFRGWGVVAVGFVTQAVAMGFSLATYSLFVPALIEDFGASRMQATLGVSTMFAMMTLIGPVTGRLLDLRSIRAVMTAGALLNASCLALMYGASTLWQLGLLFGVGVAFGTSMLGPLASATVVAKWFERKRGRALGLANMGGPAGGLLIAPIAGALIESFGWRTTLLFYAAGTLLVIPAIWLVIRNRPEDLGQVPDGEGEVVEREIQTEPTVWTTERLVRFTGFWALALAISALASTGSGWGANVVPYAQDLNIGMREVSVVIGLASGLAILGTFSFGTLADRVDLRLLMWTIIAGRMACFGVLYTEPDYTGFLFIMCVSGIVGGGMMPVYTMLIARIFGPASFGRVMGLAGLVVMPFSFAAPPTAGALRDVTGSYGPALLLFIGVLALGALVLLALRAKRAD